MGAQGSSAKKGSKGVSCVIADSSSLWREVFLDRGRERSTPTPHARARKLKSETLIQILACMIDEGNPDTELFIRAELDKYQQKDVFEILTNAFADERDIQTLRMISIFTNSSWRRKPPQPCTSGPGEFPFGNVLEAIGIGLGLIGSTSYPTPREEMICQSSIQFFLNASPGLCMGPFHPEFFGEQKGQTGDLRVKALIPHGMSSNGQFLFCLSDQQTLEVFPLMSGGSFIGRRTITLPFSVSENSSLIASQGLVKIISDEKEYRLTIDNLIAPKSKDIPYEQVSTCSGVEICCISDGASIVKVGTGFVVQTMDLSESPEPMVLNEVYLRMETLPGPKVSDWRRIPMVTNGVYLSMLLWEERTIICRTFSLITGERVGDDRIENATPIYGATLDIYNHCYWVLTQVSSGQLGIRKVYFAGGYDPHLFRMRSSVLTKNANVSANEAFEVLIRKLYVHVRQTFGSQFLPTVFDCCHGVTHELAAANFVRLIELTEQIIQSSALNIELKTILLLLWLV